MSSLHVFPLTFLLPLPFLTQLSPLPHRRPWAGPSCRASESRVHTYPPSSSSSGPSRQLSSQEGGGGGRASGQLREGICTGFPRSFTLPPLAPEEQGMGCTRIQAGKGQK